MPLRPLLAALTLLVATATVPAAAQDNRWQFRLDDDSYVWDVRLVRLDGDRLVVRQHDSLVTVPVARITEARLLRKSEMQLGTGVVGGALNALTGGDDEVYDFQTLDYAGRLRAIQQILAKYPAEPAPARQP